MLRTAALLLELSCVLLAFLLLAAFHPVGEPELERSHVWKVCCEYDDCIIQDVQIIGTTEGGTSVLTINDEFTVVSSDKVRPAPSQHWWVCYFDEVKDIAPENIRCVLYPSKVNLG